MHSNFKFLGPGDVAISYSGQQMGRLAIYYILDTNPVEVHVMHIFLVDLQHSVSISEATLLCRTPRLHISDLKAPAALVHP